MGHINRSTYPVLFGLILCMLFFSGALFSQKDSIKLRTYNPWLGMKVGVYGGPVYANMRSHETYTVGIDVWRSNFGISFQLDVNSVLAFEFDVDLVTKGYLLSDSTFDSQGNFEAKRRLETSVTYLSFPMLMKLNLRKKSGLYLSMGTHASAQMGSKKEVELQYLDETRTIEEMGFQKHPFDLGLIAGIGTEIALNKKWQIGFEGRYTWGFLPVTSEVGYPYQHHRSISFLLAIKYKKRQRIRKYKGVGDL